MKLRYTIGRRIGLGFGVLIVLIIVTFTFTKRTLTDGQSTLEKSVEINERINNINVPSLNEIESLKLSIFESKRLIIKWGREQSREDDPDKQNLITLTNNTIPATKKRIIELSDHWTEKERAIMQQAFDRMDELFLLHEDIKSAFSSFQSYDDGNIVMIYREKFEERGEVAIMTDKVLFHIDDLIKRKKTSSKVSREKMNKSFKETTGKFRELQTTWLIVLIVLALVGVIIATLTARSIVRPIHNLKKILLTLGKGVFPKEKMKTSNDEIGEMSKALNQLVGTMKQTTEFANQVGASNFDYHYEPLSEDDELGYALLKMRDDLAENERILEQKVKERTAEVVRQRDELDKQRQKLEELYKDVTDSIRYAKRLQDSILPPESHIKSLTPNSFVFFKPKDIVSGDFYWFEKCADKVLFAAVDCTGHGVPGAFMSIVGSNALQQAVGENKLATPSKILDDLNKFASETLNKEKEATSVRDGMDLALCALDYDKLTLEYAGANNPLYIIRNGEILQTKADKFPIGGFEVGEKEYTNNTLQLEKGDTIYIFSDGYADQFGGKVGKKFMYKQFRDLLLDMQSLEMEAQRDKLQSVIEDWRGSYEQVDDILVIGVKV
jgi:serine phosphatase RsbU (regulator of sigma subunit)/HAMP domain-containing protein